MRGIVVTGASNGLGAALAVDYAAPDVLLGLVGRDRGRLELTASACQAKGAQTEILAHDVAQAHPLSSWLLALDDRAPLDLLIANAGISAGPLPGQWQEGLAQLTQQIDTNLIGALNSIEPVLPRLIGRRRGTIAIVSSIAALRGLPYSPGYSASKAGLRAYGEAMRALLEPAGVKVCVICPGFFDTEMTSDWKGPKPFNIPLTKAALRIRRGIDLGRRRITFPLPLVIGLRLVDLMPAWAGDLILRAFRFHIGSRS